MQKCGHLRCIETLMSGMVIIGVTIEHQDDTVAETSSSTFQITKVGTDLATACTILT